MTSKRYFNQAKLLLGILPYVAKEDCFALKGGTAINLFVRNMPRLSIDIDLDYLPIEERRESLEKIGQALDRIAQSIPSSYNIHSEKINEPVDVTNKIIFTGKLLIVGKEGIVTIEPNTIFRGCVFPAKSSRLVKTAENRFELSVAIQTLSVADLYGGKLCAVLDRQHPRDLFDVKMLLESSGISNEIRKAFVIYLAGHNRPMHELLGPNFKDIQQEYTGDFLGMTEINVSCKDLIRCQKELPRLLRKQLSEDEKKFLISLKEGTPNWSLAGVGDIDKLPALQWKLQNIQNLQQKNRMKWNEQLQKLKSILE